MAGGVRLFVGPRTALRPFVEVSPAARVFALTPGAAILALPLTDAVHDELHAAYGTGEWVEPMSDGLAVRLTTTDMAFAARASHRSAVAFIETDATDGIAAQLAAAWIDGDLAQRLSAIRGDTQRPRSLWPVNAALRLLGVVSPRGNSADEADALGLTRYRSNDDLSASAIEIRT